MYPIHSTTLQVIVSKCSYHMMIFCKFSYYMVPLCSLLYCGKFCAIIRTLEDPNRFLPNLQIYNTSIPRSTASHHSIFPLFCSFLFRAQIPLIFSIFNKISASAIHQNVQPWQPQMFFCRENTIFSHRLLDLIIRKVPIFALNLSFFFLFSFEYKLIICILV